MSMKTSGYYCYSWRFEGRSAHLETWKPFNQWRMAIAYSPIEWLHPKGLTNNYSEDINKLARIIFTHLCDYRTEISPSLLSPSNSKFNGNRSKSGVKESSSGTAMVMVTSSWNKKCKLSWQVLSCRLVRVNQNRADPRPEWTTTKGGFDVQKRDHPPPPLTTRYPHYTERKRVGEGGYVHLIRPRVNARIGFKDVNTSSRASRLKTSNSPLLSPTRHHTLPIFTRLSNLWPMISIYTCTSPWSLYKEYCARRGYTGNTAENRKSGTQTACKDP